MKPPQEDVEQDTDAIYGYAVVAVDLRTGKRHIVGSRASGFRTLEDARRHRERCEEGYRDDYWKGYPPVKYVVVKLIEVE